MSAGQDMYRILAKTGLYNLKNGKNLLAELSSYKVALTMVEQSILKVQNSAFVHLCNPEQLKIFEELLGIPFDDSIDTQNRKKMIRHRFSILKNACNKAGLLRAIVSAGMDANIIEDKRRGSVIVECNTIFSSDKNYNRIKKEVEKLMPAHLEVQLEIGVMDWNMFMAKKLTFSQLDSEDFTWNKFDLSGHLIGGSLSGE